MELNAWKKTKDTFTLFQNYQESHENKIKILYSKCLSYPNESDPAVTQLCIEGIVLGLDFKALVFCFISSAWKI